MQSTAGIRGHASRMEMKRMENVLLVLCQKDTRKRKPTYLIKHSWNELY